MSPQRVSSADKPTQTPAQVAAAIQDFLEQQDKVVVLEDGKVLFDMSEAKFELNTDHGPCSLHLWSEECNLVRRVISVETRNGTLRLATQRFGHAVAKMLELSSGRTRSLPSTRDAARTQYLRVLERVLGRTFPDWKAEGFRVAMDLERSFGPAYVRGSLTPGKGVNSNHAWAVIGVGVHESVPTVEGVLTLGILWLHHCREHASGRRLYQGLKVVVPRGMAMLTLSRMAWLNADAAQWELWELDEDSEELTQCDIADQGNLRTRLVQHPDERAAAERFASAITQVMELVPEGEAGRVEQRLRSTAELAFLLHGLEFARARIGLAPNSFAQTLEITAGVGEHETPLHEGTRTRIVEHIAQLFARRRAFVPSVDYGRRGSSTLRRIGPGSPNAAHSRLNLGDQRARRHNPAQDPLYRAAPERWLESALRRDLAPLTRSLALDASLSRQGLQEASANDVDPDTIGNRAEAHPDRNLHEEHRSSSVIPRLDPYHVYTQVPAIVGASDRGLLDLLGVTADGRLAVIELKADEDLHFALQGLDYWLRVRYHHLQAPDALTGMGEFQRHGYFRGIELSPLPPRLYLVAPALRVHPATETVLRYLSPRVEWMLLALDERWRDTVRVVWRKERGARV